jgi:hypothetical protein
MPVCLKLFRAPDPHAIAGTFAPKPFQTAGRRVTRHEQQVRTSRHPEHKSCCLGIKSGNGNSRTLVDPGFRQ